LKADPVDPDKKVIAAAAETIRSGGLVGFPTETVYGIAANLDDPKAIDRLYAIKNRPKNKPFTVHIAEEASIIEAGCVVNEEASHLIKKFWPGPLTIILKSKKGAKIGFRMPENRIALELIRACGVPIAAPSANISGHPAPTDASSVLKELDGKIEMVIDGGNTRIGVESTVVDLTEKEPKVLREGAITSHRIKEIFLPPV
jgi:L-threonylcarbamoyladenylate synthase